MYFAYGWPKVFSTALDSPALGTNREDPAHEAPLSEQEVVYLTSGPDVLLLVTSSGCGAPLENPGTPCIFVTPCMCCVFPA